MIYLGSFIGFVPACNHGHIGGNINILPFLHSAYLSNFGNVVLPSSLSERYIKKTKNLVDVTLEFTSTCGLNSSWSFGMYLLIRKGSQVYLVGIC